MRNTIPLLVLFSSITTCATATPAKPKPKSSPQQQMADRLRYLEAANRLRQAELLQANQMLVAVNKKLALAQLELAQSRQAQEEANKKLVLTFYQRFFGDKDITAADQYLAPSYIQHNPLAATGREAVKNFFKPFFANPAIPKTKIDVRRVAADGDLVWLHIRSKTTGSERAVVDIFRIKDGKIAEHWDVIQQVPEKSLNPNTMF